MPVDFTLPPDTRAVGTGNPPLDMDNVVDALVAMGAGMSVLNTAYAGGADPTGAADSAAAIQAALNAVPAGGGFVYLPPGTYKIASTVSSAVTPTYICGAGRWATTVNFTGTGDCIRMLNAGGSGTGLWGGGVTGLTIKGGSSGAGSAGLHIGDGEQYYLDAAFEDFSGAGSIGCHIDNTVWWTEKLHGTIFARNCAQHVVFDTTSPATTVAAGSNGGTIANVASWGAGFGGSGVLAVASTAGFGTAGTVNVAASGATTAVVTYTGKTPTTLTGCVYVSGSPAGTVATGGAVTLITSTNSFGYLDLTCYLYAQVNQDGVVVQNGAYPYHGRLAIKGNFTGSASAVTNAVLRITGTVPAGHPGAGNRAQIQRCQLDIQAEVQSFANQPSTIIFGGAAGQNAILGCYGIMDFTQGAGTFTQTNLPAATNSNTFIYSGPVIGDASLNPAGAVPAPASIGPHVFSKTFINGANGNSFPNSGDFFSCTLSASITVNLNPSAAATIAAPQRKTIIIKQAAAGGPYTVTWPHTGSPTTSAPTVNWAGGTAPTMTATANAVDVYKLETYDGATWYGQALQNVS